MTTEADTCRKYVVKNLHNAKWNDDQIREQVSFTDGRIVVTGHRTARKKQKRADYILRYQHDFPIADSIYQGKLIHFRQIDKDLELSPGTAKRLLVSVAERYELSPYYLTECAGYSPR